MHFPETKARDGAEGRLVCPLPLSSTPSNGWRETMESRSAAFTVKRRKEPK